MIVSTELDEEILKIGKETTYNVEMKRMFKRVITITQDGFKFR